MIKICSLDFLNREVFDVDVMTSDGKVLICSGEKITPNILLRLYFKEIYIAQPMAEKKMAVNEVSSAAVLNTKSVSSESGNIDKHSKEHHYTASGPRLVDTNIQQHEEKPLHGPVVFAGGFADEKEKEVSTKGPRLADSEVDFDKETTSKGPHFVGPNKFETSESNSSPVQANFNDLGMEMENSQENLKEPCMAFDEKQAKKIVDYSLKMGKILKFSQEELKELEQVAYYSDIGITDFKKSDLTKKGFRKKKAHAGYEKLLNEGIIPKHLAEMVKFCANAYNSDDFQLKSQIPYYHIVGIASFYEDLLSQNMAKEEVLLKMLQLGGNQFNIFILHKFIKMMRETND